GTRSTVARPGLQAGRRTSRLRAQRQAHRPTGGAHSEEQGHPFVAAVRRRAPLRRGQAVLQAGSRLAAPDRRGPAAAQLTPDQASDHRCPLRRHPPARRAGPVPPPGAGDHPPRGAMVVHRDHRHPQPAPLAPEPGPSRCHRPVGCDPARSRGVRSRPGRRERGDPLRPVGTIAPSGPRQPGSL
ncbi:MAG: hypothetical protein AVDCRST_MAG76-460, partial [uncultured Acidimicrobiales bacterium]